MNAPVPPMVASNACPASRAEFESGTVPIRCSAWPPATLTTHYPALEHDIEADVVVIGAGLAGSSVALHLAERGVSVVMLEAAQPGNGASGRNAGHVQPFLDAFEPLQSWPGEGQPFIDFFIENRNIVFDLCAKHGIDGDAVKSGMVEAAYKKQGALETKAARWKKLGYDVDVIGADRLREMLGTEAYSYGLHWREGGQVNPYLFTHGLTGAAAGLGAHVFGNSPALSCDKRGQGWLIKTPRGSVRAQKIIICTNGHTGNAFFPELARTRYPLVACAMATKPLPQAVLDTVNPARVALTQYPAGLYPIVIDARKRMITATIPYPRRADAAQTYFAYFLRYLHRTFPQTRGAAIELESYWTGVTASSSHVYHNDFAKLYEVADGVMALMNLGTWGNVMGPLLGMNLAHAIAAERPQDLLMPLERPASVRFPGLFEFKIRHLAIPVARVADRFGLV